MNIVENNVYSLTVEYSNTINNHMERMKNIMKSVDEMESEANYNAYNSTNEDNINKIQEMTISYTELTNEITDMNYNIKLKNILNCVSDMEDKMDINDSSYEAKLKIAIEIITMTGNMINSIYELSELIKRINNSILFLI